MSAFEAKIRTAPPVFQIPEVPEGEKIYETDLVLHVLAAIPAGNGQAMPLHLGTLLAPMNKEGVTALRKQCEEVEALLSSESQIAVATSMSDVDRVAEFQNGLR